MKAAIYCRVSTDNQEREGTSLHTQLENCLKYCESKGYEVANRFSEAYSGLSLERPELDTYGNWCGMRLLTLSYVILWTDSRATPAMAL